MSLAGTLPATITDDANTSCPSFGAVSSVTFPWVSPHPLFIIFCQEATAHQAALGPAFRQPANLPPSQGSFPGITASAPLWRKRICPSCHAALSWADPLDNALAQYLFFVFELYLALLYLTVQEALFDGRTAALLHLHFQVLHPLILTSLYDRLSNIVIHA